MTSTVVTGTLVGMQVTLVQLAADLDSAANRELVVARLRDVDGQDLVVLPEATMHDFGPPKHDLAAAAEPLDGPFVGLLSQQARRLGSTIVAGMFEQTDDLPYNTLVVLGPDGDLTASYRKIHLYDSFGYRESERLRAADVESVVVPVGDLSVGLMTCYDLRFPEMGRALVDAGAEAFVVPHAAAGTGDREHGLGRGGRAGRLALQRTLLGRRSVGNYRGRSRRGERAGHRADDGGGRAAVP
jgi:predicted amidohydrolase